jgi:hypothetical protein
MSVSLYLWILDLLGVGTFPSPIMFTLEIHIPPGVGKQIQLDARHKIICT